MPPTAPSTTQSERRSVASIVDLIGNTPLVRLRSFEEGLQNVELWAKLEGKTLAGP